MKQASPSIVSQVIDQLRNTNKKSLDLKNTSGFQLFKQNLRNKSQNKKLDNSHRNIKLSQDFDTSKSTSKLKVITNRYELNYGSEQSNKNNSNTSIIKININPKESVSQNIPKKTKRATLPSGITQSTRSHLAHPEDLSNINSKANINILPNSPSIPSLAQKNVPSSKFSEFHSNIQNSANNTKHKKGSKSVSYNFNVSSLNMLKTGQDPLNLLSPSNGKEDFAMGNPKRHMRNDSKTRSNFKTTKVNQAEVDILSILANNTKSTGKLSTEGTTMSSVAISAMSKLGELDCPEELHFFYVKMIKDARKLPGSEEGSMPTHQGYH